MNVNYKNLGKVCLTPAGIWNRDKKYERIDVVTHPITGFTYIAKQDVPKGISIDNDKYWQKIGSGGYKNNNFIILSDVDPKTGKLKHYNLSKAVSSIHQEDRRPGMMLGFYGDRVIGSEIKSEWYLYQFNSNSIDDWNRLDCWVSVYDNVSHFKGYYVDEELLLTVEPYPEIGNFAFVGESTEEAILYTCSEDGTWTNTGAKAFTFIDTIKNYIDSLDLKNYICNYIDSLNLQQEVKDYVEEYVKSYFGGFNIEEYIQECVSNLIPDGYEFVIIKKQADEISSNSIYTKTDDNTGYNNVNVDDDGEKKQVYSIN